MFPAWLNWERFACATMFPSLARPSEGPVIRAAFLFNLSRNIVALQVERVVIIICHVNTWFSGRSSIEIKKY